MPLQVKDIPNGPLLAFIANKQEELGSWVCVWDFKESAYEALPPKLFRAKMSNLIKRGLITGCSCGCRGDYEITEKGRETMTSPEDTPETPYVDYAVVNYISEIIQQHSIVKFAHGDIDAVNVRNSKPVLHCECGDTFEGSSFETHATHIAIELYNSGLR